MTFSDEHGFQPPPIEITVRNDAPESLRKAIAMIARRSGMTYKKIREIVCQTLLVEPDPSNWTEVPNVRDEISGLLDRCPWPKIYDIIEALYSESQYLYSNFEFEKILNNFFMENGIGWQMMDGRIQYRGSDTFGYVAKDIAKTLTSADMPVAAQEMREAIADISRRPPDVTGALQHATAALEAVVRQVTKKQSTLGKLIDDLDLKPPLPTALKKLWGFASNEARHGSEDASPSADEAELVIVVAGAVCKFIVANRLGEKNARTDATDGDVPF